MVLLNICWLLMDEVIVLLLVSVVMVCMWFCVLVKFLIVFFCIRVMLLMSMLLFEVVRISVLMLVEFSVMVGMFRCRLLCLL